MAYSIVGEISAGILAATSHLSDHTVRYQAVGDPSSSSRIIQPTEYADVRPCLHCRLWLILRQVFRYFRKAWANGGFADSADGWRLPSLPIALPPACYFASFRWKYRITGLAPRGERT